MALSGDHGSEWRPWQYRRIAVCYSNETDRSAVQPKLLNCAEELQDLCCQINIIVCYEKPAHCSDDEKTQAVADHADRSSSLFPEGRVLLLHQPQSMRVYHPVNPIKFLELFHEPVRQSLWFLRPPPKRGI